MKSTGAAKIVSKWPTLERYHVDKSYFEQVNFDETIFYMSH